MAIYNSWHSFTVFTISAMTISPIQCTHTYTVSLCCCQGQLHLLCPSHTHTHTHARFCWCHCLVCVGPQTLQQCWVSGLYLSQPSLCCSGYNSKVTNAHTGKWKKIIFHVCEISSNGCLGGVCSYRKLFQYDVTLNCPSNTLLININSGSCNCFF